MIQYNKEYFPEDTRVITGFSDKRNGRIYIYNNIKTIVEKFKSGIEQRVFSFNTETKEIESKRVVSIFEKNVNSLMEIKLNLRKESLFCTPNHPFAVFENGKINWKKAEELSDSDYLIRFAKNKSNNCSPFPNVGYDVLLGFILGDGCVAKNRQKLDNTYRLSKNHGMNQYDYMDFCKNIFDNFGTAYNKVISGYTNKPICGFTTKSLHISKEFRDSTYNKLNKKYISVDIEKYFTLRTLALWFMDDGYYDRRRKYAVFNTQSFDIDEINILREILLKKYDMKSSIKTEYKYVDGQKTKKYFTIRLLVKSTEKMFSLIYKLMHPNLYYKLSEDYVGFFDKKLYNKIEKFNNLSISKIDSINTINKSSKVYNIEVEDNNNYFVNGILVHN